MLAQTRGVVIETMSTIPINTRKQTVAGDGIFAKPAIMAIQGYIRSFFVLRSQPITAILEKFIGRNKENTKRNRTTHS